MGSSDAVVVIAAGPSLAQRYRRARAWSLVALIAGVPLVFWDAWSLGRFTTPSNEPVPRWPTVVTGLTCAMAVVMVSAVFRRHWRTAWVIALAIAGPWLLVTVVLFPGYGLGLWFLPGVLPWIPVLLISFKMPARERTADMSSRPVPPGWYPNQVAGPPLRWWDGERWTEITHPH